MGKKKKIVVTGTRGIPNIMGGVETHCEELFPRLADKGYSVTLIRRSSYVKAGVDKKSGVQNRMWKGVLLVDLKSPRKKSFEALVHTIKAVVVARWLGANVLHIHAIGPALVTPLARLLGLKVVFTHHGPDYDRDKWGFLAKNLLKFGECLGCLFANHVIVISDVIKDLIAKKWHRTKNVSLIYNGVPTPDFSHDLEYFNSLGIEENKYVLGMCRFVPEKHLHDLVDAFILVKKKKEAAGIPFNIKLVLAGDTDFEDDYSRSLKKKAREEGVILPGFVRGKKLHSLLTNALCYSLPSSHEGLPIALLEAMSYKLPVIVSSIPANLEVGLPKECYHKVADVDHLAELLEKYIDKPAERIDYDMSSYDWDKVATQVAEVYESLK